MKKNRNIALICLSILLAVSGMHAQSTTPVASAGGRDYATLQEAIDAAALGQTEADRLVILLSDIDLGEDFIVIQGCNISLNLNGHVISGTAQALIVLENDALLEINDVEPGVGAIRGTGDSGCAILVEGAGASLVINAGTITMTQESAVAIRCTADAAIMVNGGSVSSIEGTLGTSIQNENMQGVVRYTLTIGNPPLTGVAVYDLSTQAGSSCKYGWAVTNSNGVVYAWLQEGTQFISARVGCAVYTGTVRDEHSNAAVLIKSGSQHNFSEKWFFDSTHHYKICQRAGCEAQKSLAAHSGGAASCTESALCAVCGASYSGGAAFCTQAAVCAVCGASYGEPLGHDFEDAFTVDLKPTCSEAGSQSRHCTRCEAVTDLTVIPATGHALFLPLIKHNSVTIPA